MRFDKRLILAASIVGATACGAPAQAQDACIGSLMLFGGPYCPRNYVEAKGGTLDVASNGVLFSLFGTAYGGNGTTNFGLPDLRGRAPVGQGQGTNLPDYAQGQMAGSPTTTLQTSNLPPHSHSLNASQGKPVTNDPDGKTLSNALIYNGSAPNVAMINSSIGQTGNGQPVTTQSPVQALRWCIAVQGTYCSRQ